MNESHIRIILVLIILIFMAKIYMKCKEENLFIRNSGSLVDYTNKEKRKFVLNNNTSKVFVCSFGFGEGSIKLREEELVTFEFDGRQTDRNYQIIICEGEKVMYSCESPKQLHFITQNKKKEKKEIKNITNLEEVFKEENEDEIYSYDLKGNGIVYGIAGVEYMFYLRINDFDKRGIIPYTFNKYNTNQKVVNEVKLYPMNRCDELKELIDIDKKISKYTKHFYKNDKYNCREIVTSDNIKVFPISNTSIVRQASIKLKYGNRALIVSLNRSIRGTIKHTMYLETQVPNIDVFFQRSEDINTETTSLELGENNLVSCVIENDFKDREEEVFTVTEIISNVDVENSKFVPFKIVRYSNMYSTKVNYTNVIDDKIQEENTIEEIEEEEE